MDLHGKTVCFLGDSITQGCGTSRPENSFVSLFAKAHPEAAVINCGIGGTRIAAQKTPVSPEFEHPFFSRVEELADDAALVCVFGGTNDFGHGDAPMGTFEDKTVDTFCGALRVLSEKLIEKYLNAAVVFFTPLHRTGEDVPSHRADGDWTLSDYVRAIRRNAEHYSIPVLDLYRVSGMQPQLRAVQEQFMPDGLHPNDAGHRKVFALADSFIRHLP